MAMLAWAKSHSVWNKEQCEWTKWSKVGVAVAANNLPKESERYCMLLLHLHWGFKMFQFTWQSQLGCNALPSLEQTLQVRLTKLTKQLSHGHDVTSFERHHKQGAHTKSTYHVITCHTSHIISCMIYVTYMYIVHTYLYILYDVMVVNIVNQLTIPQTPRNIQKLFVAAVLFQVFLVLVGRVTMGNPISCEIPSGFHAEKIPLD